MIFESTYNRFRKKWVGNLTAEKNRIQKLLECSNIKDA